METRIEEFREEYVSELRQVFFSSVHENARDYYNEDQLNAWAPEHYDRVAWQERILRIRPFVCFSDSILVGYSDIQADGYIDHFFVRGGYSGKGIGKALMGKLIETAERKKIKRLYSEVSLSAQRFFQRNGFRIVRKQTVEKQGLFLENAIMERILDESSNGDLASLG